MSNLFPRGIAVDSAFYDRNEERALLKRNIVNTVHTVLIAPRRFGKTSLMTQVIYENALPHLWFDFMTVTTREEIQQKLLDKVSELIVSIAPSQEKLKKLTLKYFKALRPEITLSVPGLSLKLQPKENTPNNITEALLNLDKLAAEIEKRLVVVFDEFQEIVSIDERASLQGSIRHAAERAHATTYLFSGSKHRPLRRIFSGKENPLYALCDILELKRIPANDYIQFIQKASEEKWGSPLNETILNKILDYSDRYPKYVNALCGALWHSELEPTEELITELWRRYVLSRKTDLTDEITGLTLNQKRLLQRLCSNPTPTPYSSDFLSSLKMPQSSVQKALETLLDKGLVIEDEDGCYRVLDPTLREYLTRF